MKTSNVQSSYKALIASLSESLKVAGFLRRANTFTFSYGNNVGIIEFQRSVKSSREAILFTVNVGVVLGDLLEGGLSFVRKDSILNAHLRQRIGALLPERADKWWLLTEDTDRAGLHKEVSDLLTQFGVPFLKRYLITSEVVALWESGKCPGLTEKARIRFLAKLKEKQKI